VEKVDKKGEDSEEYTLAKLVDDTLPTLERCLVGRESIQAHGLTNRL
jgi:hypothetical protein